MQHVGKQIAFRFLGSCTRKAVPLSGPLRAFDRLRALRRLVKVAGAEKRLSQPNRETGLTRHKNWSDKSVWKIP
jgi:hypothetical protein